MRKLVVAVLSAIVVGLMLVPSGVSAGSKTVSKTMYATDSTGDVGFGWDRITGEIPDNHTWGDNTPVVSTKYFDIASAWLSFNEKTRTYTFGMGLAGQLPQPGSALPTGVKFAEWIMYIDPSPWNIIFNPVPSLYKIELTYDGSSYGAELRLGTSNSGTILASLPFTIDGATFQLQFSAASIGNLALQWWVPMMEIFHAAPGSMGVFSGNEGYMFVDALDFGANPGQVYFDMPWPPV